MISDERSLNLQLCPNCKNLCESLIRTKHTVSNLIDHITNLLLQNSRFTLIHSKNMIVSELFSDFNPYSSSTTASLMLLEETPVLNPNDLDGGDESIEELDRQIADLESQFHIDKLKETHLGCEEDEDESSSGSSCSLPSITTLFDTSSSGTLPKDQSSPNSIMNVNIVGNFGASIDILSRRRRSRSHNALQNCSDHNSIQLHPPMPHLIADTDNDELELCFSNKLAQQKETEVQNQKHNNIIIQNNQHQSSILLLTQANGINPPLDPNAVPLNSNVTKNISNETTRTSLSNSGSRKKYNCNLCPRICQSKKDLNVHMGSHLQERKFICEVCGLTYR